MLILSVKDRDLFGISNQYVAECFITFAEIERSDGVQQIHLTLNRPNTTGSFKSQMAIIKVLTLVFVLKFSFRLRLYSCIGAASR